MNNNLPAPIRVMIVDDSAVIRSIIDKILKTDDQIEVCGFASSGDQAVHTISICNPDVILLDIEMPVMDGITAIPLLLEKNPNVRIIMCSTLSERGASISVKALSLGATDCILKPSGSAAIQQNGDFHANLLRMVRSIGAGKKRQSTDLSNIKLNPHNSKAVPKIIAIGSSTGGPNALALLLKDLKDLTVPIVITQHMPKTFTKILADHLTTSTGVKCFEGEENMILQPGHAYIAPGGLHMGFKRSPEGIAITLNDGPMENFCKPAVDPMLRSLSSIYNEVFTVILTGMGEDGLAGSRKIVEGGGQIIAQDAASSVVWGMPGAVANAGICSAVLPLSEIAFRIRKLCHQIA